MKGKYAKEKVKTNSVLKKFILMAIIVTMLAGDFILPIKLWSIAKEIENIQNSISAVENEASNSNLNESTNNNDAENGNLTDANTSNGENSANAKDNLENGTDAGKNSEGT